MRHAYHLIIRFASAMRDLLTQGYLSMLLPTNDDPTGQLSDFVLSLEEVVACELSPHRLTDVVSARLSALVAAGQRNADLLAPQFRTSSPDAYQTHLIAVAPSRRFSL